jgi:hypothetical protein
MKIKLVNVRLSFPGLFEATKFNDSDNEAKFKATFLIPKGSALDKQVWVAIKSVAADKFGKKSESIIESIKGNPNRFGYRDGDTQEYDGYEGMMSLTAKNTTRPLIIDAKGISQKDEKEDGREYTEANATGVMFPILKPADGKPYAGCFVNATVEVFPYLKPGQGISFSLKGVQFARDGDAFGGGAPASPDDFEDLGVSDENSEAGGSDDDLAG